MKNILQICPHDSPPFGGLCQNIVLAGALADAQVTTVYIDAASAEPYAGVHYLGITDLADVNAIGQALKALPEQSWDLVICHRYRSYRAAVSAGISKASMVVLAHEYGLLNRLQRRLYRLVFTRACRFAGVAPGIAAELADVTGETLVLPNSLDTDRALNALHTRAQALELLGLPESTGPTIGVVGRLHYKKRPQLALHAFEIFAAQYPDARLVFLGEGEQYDSLKTLSDGNVHLLGSIPNAAKLFKGFDILLHTADAEPFGMVILEAMLAGVPVVTLADHGPHYILGELGVYADQDDAGGFASALARATQIERTSLDDAGRARAQKMFSISALAQHLAKLTETHP